MKKEIILIAFILLPFLSAAQKVSPENYRIGGMDIGSKFPSIELTSLNGQKKDLSKIEDKIIVVNYWFVGCKGCKEEKEFLKVITKYFEGNDLVEFVSITPSKASKVNSYISKSGDFGYPVYLQSGFKGVEKNFNIRSYPHHQIIVNGIIVEKFAIPISLGYLKDWMINRIEKELSDLK